MSPCVIKVEKARLRFIQVVSVNSSLKGRITSTKPPYRFFSARVKQNKPIRQIHTCKRCFSQALAETVQSIVSLMISPRF